MKTPLGRIAFAALGAFLIALAAQGANYIKFLASSPEAAQQCNYTGQWESTIAPLVSGRILATLPTPLPK